MKKVLYWKQVLFFLFICLAGGLRAAQPEVPAGIDHAPLDRLLQRYVDEKGLVDYKAWKSSSEDMAALQEYLAQFAPVPDTPAEGDDLIGTWLARADLNRYDPEHGWRSKGRVEISRIFSWYSEDYKDAHTVEKVLETYGPPEYRDFFKKAEYSIRYQSYDWGLNDQGDTGDAYRHNPLRSLF